MLAMATETRADVRKVLVVDDQEDVREALRLLLKSAGYVTETVESPREAVAAAVYGGFDLIVIDMNYTWDTTSGEEGLGLLALGQPALSFCDQKASNGSKGEPGFF